MNRAHHSLAALAVFLVSGCGLFPSGTNSCLSSSPAECVCLLQSGSTVSGPSCSSTSVTNGVCCAELGWPGSGLTCSCGSYACRETATDGSCSCDTESGGPNSTCTPQSGFTCCQHVHTNCECGPAVMCDATVGDHVVTSCTRSSAVCSGSTEQIVTACH